MVDLLKDGDILYHGSFCEVQTPDLQKCARYKDFGQGFYLTTDKKQAESFAKISTQKAIENGVVASQKYGVVSAFRYNVGVNLNIKIYETAESSWLHCVVAHRKKNVFADVLEDCSKYDVIGGKIANDATNSTIVTYMANAFGEIGSDSADDICIRLLLPERLKNQYCFKSVAALNQLSFMGSERVWM